MVPPSCPFLRRRAHRNTSSVRREISRCPWIHTQIMKLLHSGVLRRYISVMVRISASWVCTPLYLARTYDPIRKIIVFKPRSLRSLRFKILITHIYMTARISTDSLRKYVGLSMELPSSRESDVEHHKQQDLRHIILDCVAVNYLCAC